MLSLIWSEMPDLTFAVHHADIVAVLSTGSFISLLCMSSVHAWMYLSEYSSLILQQAHCP